MKHILSLLLLALASSCLAQTPGYYHDSYGRAYYMDRYGNRHYLYDANVDPYGYRYYVDQYGQRHYLYEGPYVGPMAYETRRADFDIGKVGVPGRTETEPVFKTIWSEFRKNFSLNESGSFDKTPGVETPDNDQTRAAFLRFVAEQSPEVTVPFTDKCSRCDGKGLKVGLVDNYYYGDRRMQSAGQKVCDACNGTGGTKGVTIYRLSYTTKAKGVQAKAPATQSSSDQAKLAEQGDAAAQLRMGDYYWLQEGRAGDSAAESALKWYGRSLIGGNAAAVDRLVQIHATSQAGRPADHAFARAIAFAYKSADGKQGPSAAQLAKCRRLEELEARVLAKRLVELRDGEKRGTEQWLDPRCVRQSLVDDQPKVLSLAKDGDDGALCQLGLRYALGLGGATRNPKIAISWLEQAACKGDAGAFYVLGAMHEDGEGVARNLTAAHALYTVAAKLFNVEWTPWETAAALEPQANVAASSKAAAELLELAKAGKLTEAELQALSRLPAKSQGEAEATAVADPPEGGPGGYATGFVFTKEGHIFTSAANISGARTVNIVRVENGVVTQKLAARIVKVDQRNDLALLQCAEWKPGPGAPADPPPLTPAKYCRLGDQVFALGYTPPYSNNPGVKYTKGDITDLNGNQDDGTKLQHTITLQPGNAGGPICLMDGRIVGLADDRSDIKPDALGGPGAHFSLKADYMLALAQVAGIEVPVHFIDGPPVEHVKAYTVQIYCER